MKQIYHNARVYNGSSELAEAFVVEDRHFLFVGSKEEAMALACDGDELIDLQGHFVCPGFNDSHMHLMNYGNVLSIAPLAQNSRSLSALLDCLSRFLAEHPLEEGAWLMGRGWNQDYFQDEKRMPTRYDLDRVSTTVPICATRVCGHCLVVNSKALELLGVTADTPSPAGGRISKDAKGEPDGLFFDNAMDMVYDAVPAPNKEQLKNLIRLSCRALNSYGVTSSQTDDYANFRGVPWQWINQAYQELEDAGELTVRVCEQANFTSVAALQEYIDAGNTTGVGSDFFRCGPLKLLGDGALGARTAYLSRPYADDPSTLGLPVFSQQLLDDMILTAHKNGLQVCVHCIGDACLDMVLSAYEKALTAYPRADHRHGIVHCQITRPEQLKKIADLQLHVYAQSIFLDYDINIVEARVGDELAASSYSWKTLMKQGVSVSNGSDCPVELPFCLGSMQCAVTRQNLNGDVDAYLPEEAFTIREALDSYTIEAAKASFEEQVKGQIAAGFLADFVVLGENIFTIPPQQLKNVPVLATYVGGKEVYHR